MLIVMNAHQNDITDNVVLWDYDLMLRLFAISVFVFVVARYMFSTERTDDFSPKHSFDANSC